MPRVLKALYEISMTSNCPFKLTSERASERASRRDNMARDHSEYIDDYCRDNYGHSNWGYLDTYTKEELKKADHDIENNIVFWHEDDEDEEGDE